MDLHISKRLEEQAGRNRNNHRLLGCHMDCSQKCRGYFCVPVHTVRAIGLTTMLVLWIYLNSLCFIICIIFSYSGKVLQIFSLCWKTSVLCHLHTSNPFLWNFSVKFFPPVMFIMLVCLLLNLEFLSLNLVFLQNWDCSCLDHIEDIICSD